MSSFWYDPTDAASIKVGTTTTSAPGSNAFVENIISPPNAVLNFRIPRGDAGSIGPSGPQGIKGDKGDRGDIGPIGSTGAQGPQGIAGPSGVIAAISPLDYNSGTQTISLQQATASQSGYLSSNSFNTFNNKISNITYTPSTPTRALNTTFTPSAKNATLCIYTISISCNMSLTSGQTGTVELRSDINATPTTTRARVSNTNSGALTIGLSLINAQEAILIYLCPPSHNVRLVSSGTATISITTQTEITITAL